MWLSRSHGNLLVDETVRRGREDMFNKANKKERDMYETFFGYTSVSFRPTDVHVVEDDMVDSCHLHVTNDPKTKHGRAPRAVGQDRNKKVRARILEQVSK